MTTGQTIKRVRQSEGMTVQTVSILTGLSERFISYIEQDKKKPSLRSLNKLADAFDRVMIIKYTPDSEPVVTFDVRERLRSESFDNRIAKLKDRLYKDCLFLSRNDEEKAKDLTQETICRALIYHYRFNENSQLYTWLFKIAKSVAAESVRNDKYLTFVDEYFETEQQIDELSYYGRLSKYLNRLSPKAKEVYKLRLLNVGYREIAEKLNITEAGAKSWFWSIKGNIKKMAV